MKVEQTLREVQISRSRLRFILLWLEQIVPTVTVSTAADGAEQADWRPPHHTLAKSVLSILKEPLPSDAPASGARNSPVPTSRVRHHRCRIIVLRSSQVGGSGGSGRI